MTEADRRRILGVGSDLAAKALRVLAVAQRNQSGPPKSLEAQELELRWSGAPRPGSGR